MSQLPPRPAKGPQPTPESDLACLLATAAARAAITPTARAQAVLGAPVAPIRSRAVSASGRFAVIAADAVTPGQLS